MKHTQKKLKTGRKYKTCHSLKKHACNRRNQWEIWVVLNSIPAASIKHRRVWVFWRYLRTLLQHSFQTLEQYFEILAPSDIKKTICLAFY